MVQVGWRTRLWDSTHPPKERYRNIPTKTWPELKEHSSHLTFDHLVIDCEGAFLPIVKEWPSILEWVTKIIFENDFETDEEAEDMRKIFIDAWFSLIDTKTSKASNVKASRRSNFHQVWYRSLKVCAGL